MSFARVIPVLLLSGNDLIKTKNFKDPIYLGDPVNTVRIFNEKEVDEIVFLDIEASKNNSSPSFELISEIACEAFYPFSYGGGINKIEDVITLQKIGVEKIILNKAAIFNYEFVKEAVSVVGSSGIVVAIDFRKNWKGKYTVYTNNGFSNTGIKLSEHILNMEKLGVGELFITSIDREGEMNGYDCEMIKEVSSLVSIPIIVNGGAGTICHFEEAIKAGASAVAAGSMFVFHGRHRGVLLSYPSRSIIDSIN